MGPEVHDRPQGRPGEVLMIFNIGGRSWQPIDDDEATPTRIVHYVAPKGDAFFPDITAELLWNPVTGASITVHRPELAGMPRRVYDEGAYDRSTGKTVTVQDDPEAWMRLVMQQDQSSTSWFRNESAWGILRPRWVEQLSGIVSEPGKRYHYRPDAKPNGELYILLPKEDTAT